MIGFFPDPYPDELFYSICSRYHFRTKYKSKIYTVTELFGKNITPTPLWLPHHLGHFIEALPAGHRYSVDRLIDKHTLVPLFGPFLPPKHLQQLRKNMYDRYDGATINSYAGIPLNRVAIEYLRFCPACAEEDKSLCGEPYWHRVHQVIGADICLKHLLFLERSKIRVRLTSGNPFTTAKEAVALVTLKPLSTIPVLPHRPLNLQDRHHSLLLKLARDVTWLLDRCVQPRGMMFLYERYYNLLLKRRLAFYNGRVRTTKLSKQLIEFYSIDFLNSLQCNIERHDRGWVYDLVHTNTDQTVQHPLRHLLLMTFLGCSAQEFFTSFEECTPFGKGPWPCFNKASDHYMESRITDCRIIDSRVTGKASRPMGTFRCDCGFTYTRMGPDSVASDRLRADSVQDYGRVWENRLRELWVDSTVTQYQIADILGTAQNTVVRRGIYFGLQYPRNVSTNNSSRTVHKRYKIIRQPIQDDLMRRRECLLILINEYPKAGRLELQNASPYLIDWLRRHDRDWLDRNLPWPRRSRPKGVQVDWQGRDKKLAAAIKEAVICIHNNDDRPIRVSLAEIIRAIGHQGDLEQYLRKLPHSAKTLSTHLESLEAFAIRKIEWAESCYVQEGIYPTRYQFMVRAAILNKTGRTSVVQRAVDVALERLDKNVRLQVSI